MFPLHVTCMVCKCYNSMLVCVKCNLHVVQVLQHACLHCMQFRSNAMRIASHLDDIALLNHVAARES